jgi:hypothetical protein
VHGALIVLGNANRAFTTALRVCAALMRAW